jgi:uncharacterized protein (TIGR02453 family)
MSFDGFPKALPAFLRALGDNNSRDWFQAHRSDYEQAFLAPAQAFIEALAPKLAVLGQGLRAEPKVDGSIRRLNRDIRFSKDKTPYNAHLHLIFWRGDKATVSPGFHFVITADRAGAGAGMYAFGKAELERYRTAIGDPDRADRLARAVSTAAQAGGGDLDPPALKRVPAGIDPTAPNAELARHKGIVVRRDLPLDDALFGPAAPDYVLDRFRPLAPVHNWLVDEVAG